MAATSRSSSSSQSDSTAGTKRKREIDAEQEFLKLIRDTFGSSNDHRYRQFLRVMEDYKNGEYNTSEIISFAQMIFKGHPKLLTGFKILLPSGYSIDYVAPKMGLAKKLGGTVDSVDLVHKIKTRLQNDKSCYNSFLDLMLQCQRNSISVDMINKELPIIFRDYPDLIPELQKYISRMEED